MEVSLHWEKHATDAPTQTAKVHLTPYKSTESVTENPTSLDKFHVESFCTANYHIIATYDKNPLTSVTILVTTPHLLRASGTASRAQKLNYKSVAHNCTEHFQQSRFSPIDDFSFVASIRFIPEHQVSGVLFRIVLNDGSQLEQFDGGDYFVGNGKRRIPYSLEIPLSWPLDRPIQRNRVLSLYRSNLFWLQPQLDSGDLNQLLHETNFVLVALEYNGFACFMPTRDSKHALRATLFSTGTYAAIRIESSSALPFIDDITDMLVCHLAVATDPFSAVRAVIEAHSLQRQTFSSRSKKLSSPKWRTLNANAKILTRLGYCTWDAVGHKCSEESVLSTLHWLEGKQIPISYVIVDDGWQDGGASGPLSSNDSNHEPSPKLVSFLPNHKFPSSLRPLSFDGKLGVYVWMTLIGYWGGTDGTCFQRDTIHVTLQTSIGLQRNQTNDYKMWERAYEIMEPATGNLEGFFTDYFKTLSIQGVTCVKIDGQSILGSFTTSDRNLSTLVGEYRDALHRAAEQIFPDEVVLNSMACAKEIILHSGTDLSVANACWRTSDDHLFPGMEETDDMVAWHVLRNAMNSLFLGEIFPVTDWDMFRLCDKNAYMHAVARVLSGGPIYISDSVPFNEEFEQGALNLVRRLTTADGRIVRCHDPGRPTVDCLFGDPRGVRMFKVFNRNAVSGVVGLFNLSSREGGYEIGDDFCAGDVEDFRRGPQNGFITVVIGEAWRCAFKHDSCVTKQGIGLRPMEAAIAHIYPILHFADGLEMAPVGRLDLLNCAAVVKSVSAWEVMDEENWVVEVSIGDCGTVAVWLGEDSVARLIMVTACDERKDIVFVKIDELSFLSVTVQESQVREDILLRMTFSNANAHRCTLELSQN